MAELILNDLTKPFGRKNEIRAVDHLSLHVRSGELLALLGPSGSGKTTLLRLLAGLEEPASGEIALDGKSLLGLPAPERHISMAFQFPALLPQLNVLENLQLGPKLRKVRANEAKSRVEEAVQLLGIAPLLERKPQELSGGEQQRAALARAMIARPRLLLLDEPLASLDPIARIELRQAIRRLQKALQLTTLYVTHEQSEAVALGDRIALLHTGRLQQVGTAADLFAEPENLFVARFFGPDPLNIVPGRIVIADGAAHFISEEAGCRIPLPKAAACEGTVTAAFRPSAVRFGEPGWAGQILETIDYGWKKLVTIQVNKLPVIAEAPAVPLRTAERTSFAVSALLFFKPDGQRLPIAFPDTLHSTAG